MIWIIGSSSDYSKAVANEFDNVKTFGRHNIDYTQPFDKFIAKQKEMPNKIFINIRAEQDFAVDIDSSDKAYKKMLEDFLPIWLWKIRLYSYFYKQKVLRHQLLLKNPNLGAFVHMLHTFCEDCCQIGSRPNWPFLVIFVVQFL